MFLMTLALTELLQTQGAQAILRTAQEKQYQRWAPLRNYALINSVNGIETPEYRVKMVVRPTEAGDSTGVAFRVVPISEWSRMRTPTGEPMSDQELKAMASGMAKGYGALADMARRGERNEEMPIGTPFGALMNDAMGDMFDVAADYVEFTAASVDSISDGKAEAREELQGARAFADRARLVGRDLVEGREAWLLRAAGLADVPIEQAKDAPTFVLEVASLWLDATEYVPLRLKMDGRMTADGQTTPVTIELLELDYRTDKGLYLSHRQVMRLSGLMQAMSTDPKQKKDMEKMRKDLAKAQAQMANMEGQLAAMPPAQRRMVEGQMNKMKAQMEMMANQGVVQAEVLRRVHSVNEGPPLDWIPMQGTGR